MSKDEAPNFKEISKCNSCWSCERCICAPKSTYLCEKYDFILPFQSIETHVCDGWEGYNEQG